MKIQILGTGCPKCGALERNAREAMAKTGIQAEIEKITDLDDIMAMGVMVTPALAIDGEVKKAGKVLTEEEISEIIKGGA
jgi:small redox-active disulfide protein 2